MNNFTNQFESLSFPLVGLVRYPQVDISEEDLKEVGLAKGASNRDFLRKLCWTGYLKRKALGQFNGIDEKDVITRFKAEFEVFDRTGIIEYLLLVWDINRYCDKKGIIRGPGRGSCAGSLVLYTINITNVNPLRHGLFLSRFVSEARLKPVTKDGILYVDGKMAPDIDGDYSFWETPQVLEYINNKYKGQTCKISTALQLTAKTALKDVLKVFLELSEESSKWISDNVEVLFGKVEKLSKTKEKPKIKEWLKENPLHEEAFAIAQSIVGLTLTKGQHPSGIAIYHGQLDGNVPTELSKTKEIVSSFDSEVMAGIALKADILKLRTLNIISECEKLTGQSFANIDVNDPIIYQYLSSNDNYSGIFQIESGLTKEMVKIAKPRNINDIAALIGLSRPGAMQHAAKFYKYIETGKIESIYPPIDKILEITGGALIMQEQITAICHQVFGLSEIESDQVRYASGKKIRSEMDKWESVIFAKGKEKGIPDDIVKSFWSSCSAAADYSFNLSHAFCYGYLTATTTYIKAKYPKEFYLAMLRLSSEEPDGVAYMREIFNEMKKVGIKIYPPNLVKSGADFTLLNDGILFGLNSIKGISQITMSKLLSFRRDFKSKYEVFDAARESRIAIGTLVGLIRCGALDSGNISRSRLVLEAQTYNILKDKEKRLVQSVCNQYDDDLLKTIVALTEKVDEHGKPFIKKSRMETIRRDYTPFKEMYKANSSLDNLTSYIMERHYLGFSANHSLNEIFSAKVEGLLPLNQVVSEPKDIYVKFVAFIDEVKSYVSREKKTPYMKFHCSSDEGKITALLFGGGQSDRIEQLRQFHGKLPEPGDIVIIHGKKADGDAVFVDKLFIQNNPVKIKKSELDKGPDAI